MIDQTTDTAFDEWVILELMGHRRLAGHLREQEIAGDGFLRLDIFPGPVDEPTATQYYRPGAVYCITPTTEQMARLVALVADPGPVKRWELPAPEGSAANPTDPYDPYNDDQDDDDGDELHARVFGGGPS